MLRSLVLKRAQSTAVWSDFTSRAASLGLKDSRIKSSLFSKALPASMEASRRQVYHSPQLIDETFSAAYELLQQDAAKTYAQIETLKRETNPDIDTIHKLSVEAEKCNPEVLFNVTTSRRDQLDMSQPVYRELAKKQWESRDLMLTMQRLEQLKVIPDTMPTLDPKVEVKVKFPHNTESEFSDWVTPGEIVPCFSVSRPPKIQIQDYEGKQEHLYTVVLVNPDTPNVKTNSFDTTLHYGLSNIPLSSTKTEIPSTIDEGFARYIPLTPEVNAGNQRACLWVFRQEGQIDAEAVREKFDIRAFAEKYRLTAVGAHVWRQIYDRSVNEVRDKYALGRGRVFEKVRGTRPLEC